MPERRSIFLLIIILAGTALTVAAVSIILLYRAAFEAERDRLMETAQSQARLLEAVARFDQIYSTDFPGGGPAATLSQMREAHESYTGFGKTGEFTLAQLEGEDIIFLLRHRHFDTDVPQPVPFDSELAEPMRRALMGQSGTVVGLDYRGVQVLAAYEPVEDLGWGIVAKIDLTEIRAPFIRAGLIAGAVTLLVTILGSLMFFKVTNPLLQELAESREYFRTTLYSIGDAVLVTDTDGRIQHMNPVAEALTGWREAEGAGQPVSQVFQIVHEDTRAPVEDPVQHVLREGMAVGLANHTLLRSRVGEEYPIADSGAPIRARDGKIAGVVLVFRDQTAERESQKALRESEVKYRLLFENVMNGFALHELVLNEIGQPIDYLFVEVNQAFEQLTGLKRDQIVGKKVTEVLPGIEDDSADWIGLYGKVALTGQSARFIQFSQPLGRWYSVLAFSAQTGQFATIFEDITDQKQTEEALRRSEARLQAFVRAMPDLGFVIGEDGQYIEVLGAREDLLVAEASRLKGSLLSEVLPGEEAALCLSAIADTLHSRETKSVEYELEVPAGRHWFEARIAPLTTETDERSVVFLARDVTDSKKAYDEVERQARYLHALNQASHRVSRWGLDLSGVLGAIVTSLVEVVNIAFARLWVTSNTGEELILRASAGLHTRLDGARARLRISDFPGQVGEIARTRQPFLTNNVQGDDRFDQTWVREKGIVSFAGYPLIQDDRLRAVLAIFDTQPLPSVAVDMLGAFVNQTAIALENSRLYDELESYSSFLKQAVEERTAELRETKERVETILNHSPDATLLLDEYGAIETANPSFYRMFGYKQAEINGQIPTIFVIADQIAHCRRVLERAMQGGEPQRVELTAKRKDGSTFDAQAVLGPVREDNKLLGVVCSLRDITALKEIERMKDEFLSTAAHELRTPLTSIQGFSEILLTRDLEDGRRTRYLAMINEQATQLAQIINELLDLSRLEARRQLEFRPEPVLMGDLVEEVMQSFADTSPHHRFERIGLDGTPLVLADRFRLAQVLRNLVSNAVKYSPNGGAVRIRGQVRAGHLEVSVEDEGIGLTPEQETHLFERFYRANPSGTSGTGLGLAICKLIVDGHGGEIRVESRPGAGSIFTFTIPLAGETGMSPA